MHIVAWITEQCDSLFVSWDVGSSRGQEELRGVVGAIQVGPVDGARAVDALQVRLWRAYVVEPGGERASDKRRAIGRHVVGDELPEERSHRRHVGVGRIGTVDANVARSTRPAESVQRVLVDAE
jgi:hypothetical protein